MCVELEPAAREQGEHGFHLNSTEILPEAHVETDEKNFPYEEAPERSSQRSQPSQGSIEFDLGAMIDDAATAPKPDELAAAAHIVETAIRAPRKTAIFSGFSSVSC